MNYKAFIGIDVSRDKIDVSIHGSNLHSVFVNTDKGFLQMCQWLRRAVCPDMQQWLLCLEHTGIYALPISVFLTEQQLTFALTPALAIKRSMGITRGKNDRVDARAIARYAYLKRDEIKPTKLPAKQLIKLQQLLSLRERLVVQRAGFRATVKEYGTFISIEDNPELFQTQEQMIKQLGLQITKLEKAIKDIIKNDKIMAEQFKLVTSVTGIGLILGAQLIASTQCFERFSNWRQFACYSGIAPFKYESGSSIRGKTRVSHLANKRLKSLLYLAACNAVQHNAEIKAYYQRRLNEGKSKMSTLNIVRNKIVARVFAAVKRQSPYLDLMKYAA